MLQDDLKAQLVVDLEGFRTRKAKNLWISVSGGLDSTVLMHLCANVTRELGDYLEGSVQVIHCNFHLRGQESQEDEVFVLSEAKKLGFNVEKHDFRTERDASIQAWARQRRQALYREKALQGDIVALGHHEDDLLENLVFRSAREVTIDRVPFFSTFDPKRRLWRPLLRFSREKLQAFAQQNQVKYREDSSNASLKYARNFVRHHITPALIEVSPAAKQHLLGHGKMLAELFEFFDRIFAKEVAQKALPKAILVGLPELLRLRLLREWLKFHAPEAQWVSQQTLQKVSDSSATSETQWDVGPGISIVFAKNHYLIKTR